MSATLIQKLYRGYLIRKFYHKRKVHFFRRKVANRIINDMIWKYVKRKRYQYQQRLLQEKRRLEISLKNLARKKLSRLMIGIVYEFSKRRKERIMNVRFIRLILFHHMILFVLDRMLLSIFKRLYVVI
jgi:hypothetical protein